MLFKDYHIPMIRSGSKTATRREWSEHYAGPNVGSVVAATTELFVSDEEADCYIRITDRYSQRLGQMTEEDAQAEGDYRDLYDFKTAYEDVYGDDSFDPWKVVDVVEFEYVGRERPQEQQELVTDGGRPGVAVGRSGLIFDKPAYPDDPTHWPHPAYRSPVEYVPVWHLTEGAYAEEEGAVA